MVEQGELDDARNFLTQAFEEGSANSSKAENACWLAILFARQRNSAEAQKYLDTAKTLNPTCVMLARAEQELTAAFVNP